MMNEARRMLRSLLTERARLKGDWERLGAARQSLAPTYDALTRNSCAIAALDLDALVFGGERDLRERLERAVARLEERRDATHTSRSEHTRLSGKVEGVKLALSYLEEQRR